MSNAKGLILVVEDEVELNEIIAEMLRGVDYEVLQAFDGVEGQRLFERHAADLNLVLCDISMPNVDGFEFLTASTSRHGFVPFVILSAHDDVGRLIESSRLGAVDYIVKPVAILTLIEQMPRWLAAARNKGRARPVSPES